MFVRTTCSATGTGFQRDGCREWGVVQGHTVKRLQGQICGSSILSFRLVSFNDERKFQMILHYRFNCIFGNLCSRFYCLVLPFKNNLVF